MEMVPFTNKRFAMIEYIVRAHNSIGGFHMEFSNERDASISVNAIKKANAALDMKDKDKYVFHGWVTRWEGYALEDGSRVTQSADCIRDLDF